VNIGITLQIILSDSIAIAGGDRIEDFCLFSGNF